MHDVLLVDAGSKVGISVAVIRRNYGLGDAGFQPPALRRVVGLGVVRGDTCLGGSCWVVQV